VTKRKSSPSFIVMRRLDTRALRRLTSGDVIHPSPIVREAVVSASALPVLAMPLAEVPPSRRAGSPRTIAMLVAGALLGFAIGHAVLAGPPRTPSAPAPALAR
jgi:hypothetical protein